MNAFIEALRKKDALILDTETTGTHRGAEILQIGIASLEGEELFYSYVRPVKARRWDDAQRVHGITWSDVENAPTIGELAPALEQVMSGRAVAIYNADFDRRMFWQSIHAEGVEDQYRWMRHLEWPCVMKAYARHWGQWNPHYRSYRWQTLSNACRQQGVRAAGAHDALTDAKLTAALIRAVERKLGQP